MAKIINKANNKSIMFTELEVGGIFEYEGNFYMGVYDSYDGEVYAVNLYSGHTRRDFSATIRIIPRLESEIIIK